jgi:hypothetical protein
MDLVGLCMQSIGLRNPPSFIVIATESAHAYRADQEVFSGEYWATQPMGEVIDKDGLYVHRDFENRVRADFGLTLRTTYSGVDLGAPQSWSILPEHRPAADESYKSPITRIP